MNASHTAVSSLLSDTREQVLRDWLTEVGTHATSAARNAATLATEAASLLDAIRKSLVQGADLDAFEASSWQPVRDVLADLSASRAAQGVSVSETSFFVLGIKRPLFRGLQTRFHKDPEALLDATWSLSTLIDKMAQLTVGIHQKAREEVIARQQAELLELSTPVVKLWEGVLAVPMIGTLDSGRTHMVMQALLERIVETGSELAIIDITGVPTVDTLVAQHLLKTVSAIRLMGADCIISGIRPQIAQTIVHLGIDLQGITTRATLADALRIALQRTGYTVVRGQPARA